MALIYLPQSKLKCSNFHRTKLICTPTHTLREEFLLKLLYNAGKPLHACVHDCKQALVQVLLPDC